MHEAILVEGTINFSNTLTMMNLLSLLLALLLTVPVYSQTGPNTLSDSSDIVKTRDGYVLGKKSDIGKMILKDKSKLTVLGFDVDTTSFIDCLVTKFESLDKDALFKKEDSMNFIMTSCFFSCMKINKGVFGKNILKGLSKLEGSVFHIDTNDFADCLATKFESSDRVTFFKKDTISYITEACFFSCLKLNKSVFGKEIQKRLSKLEGSGVYIDTNIFNECFLTKFKLSNKEVFFKEGTKNLLETCFYNSLKIDKSYIAKIVLKELSSLKYLGYDIDTINCIDCLVSKYESLGKDALFNKDTVSFIINGCVFSSMRINKDSVLRIALLEFCKDSLAKIRSDLKKLSIEGEESLETYCDCFAKNLLKIGDSKRKEVINEWKSLSGEYNNGVVFPCIQLAQNKARQKNDMYNPNDIIGSVDSSTIELLRIGDSKMVQVTIGDITKYYVLDTGADLLIIDDKSEHELISNKKLLPSMFIGEKQLTLADNRQVNAKIYKINNVRIGDYIVRNIEIGVIENGFLLCGMSLLKKFKDWKIESELNVLKLFK